MDVNQELSNYLRARNYKLCRDEIFWILDNMEHFKIDHVVYENGNWKCWNVYGYEYNFSKRDW